MKQTFLTIAKFSGIPFVVLACALATRLVWEQTVLSWDRGPQMVGFSLMHSEWGVLLVLAQCLGLIWLVIYLITAALTRGFGGKTGLTILLIYAFAWGLILTPYGVWQWIFIDKFTPAQATSFFTYAAATGELRVVKAFLERGMDVNTQGSGGTALHGAVVQGELEVIEYLIAHGADVNAINAYGDSPLENAIEGRERTTETQALLVKHGAKLIRGSAEQRDRVIGEQVRKDIEAADKYREELDRRNSK